MNFIEAFLSFQVQISNSYTGVFEELRLKLPKHELDTWNDFFAGLCAYCHAYEPGLELLPSRGNFDFAFRALNHSFEEGTVGFIGLPPRKILLRLLKIRPEPSISIYFQNPSQIATFCGELRGSKSNWIASLKFFLLEAEVIDALEEAVLPKNELVVTIVEPDCLYIGLNDREYILNVSPVDMWKEYQLSIGNLQDRPQEQ